VSTDETPTRSEMERRVTEDDRTRPETDQEQGRADDGTRPTPPEPTPTQPTPTEPTRAEPRRTVAEGAVVEGAVVEERRVVPGSARGRLHVGINWGAAFFGWVAAMGLAVILTAFVAAVGAAVGVTQGTTVEQATTQIQNQDAQTLSIVGLILLAVIAFVSYYGGGYVAARMSRFDGARQGFGVWLLAVIVAVAVAVVAAIAGARYDVLSTLNTFPRLPVDQGSLTGMGIVALVLLLAITLLGAVIGGAAGMRYHRKLETAEAEYLQ
jgi:hypothetical protein